eukprot:scaffold328398_cov90-Tisochrysis_lutea.AAC.1
MLSSRDASAFALGCAELLGSWRLGLVLNSLSLDFISASMALLRDDGWLTEIGKRAVWSGGRHACASASRYVVLALDSAIEQSADWMRGTLRQLCARVSAHVLHGLPRLCFDMEHDLTRAFRCLQNGANIGKVVVRLPPAVSVSAHSAHLLTGGTGGLGLLTGRWLGESGALLVVLASRSGTIGARETTRLKSVKPCTIRLARCDAADAADVRRLTCGMLVGDAPRLCGMWHAAGVLADGLLLSQTASTVRR